MSLTLKWWHQMEGKYSCQIRKTLKFTVKIYAFHHQKRVA